MYDRTFDGKPYEFGVIGAVKGTLILYDKQTKSRWSQLFGKAIEGPMEGRRLEKLPSTMTTWGQWRQLHPATTVYVKPTAYSRRFTAEHFAHIAQAGDGPVQPEDLVVGFEGHIQARAYLVRRLARQRLVQDTFEDAPILVYLSADYTTARGLFKKDFTPDKSVGCLDCSVYLGSSAAKSRGPVDLRPEPVLLQVNRAKPAIGNGAMPAGRLPEATIASAAQIQRDEDLEEANTEEPV